ncbi:MAG TPA: preprotein translocase subunit SecY [Tepidisphaeraceae bacterium]|nr:preprotein translocase subunit SecY [Tepidisphaeraceae bacterium]
MFKTFINIFKVPELRNKVLFTLLMLLIYRIGYHVPLPGVDQDKMHVATTASGGKSPFDQLASYVSIFSGGNLSQSTLFGLGIMPYISAAIIFQLLGTVMPSLEKLQKEGQTGQQKIQEWTRYATVPLCVMQAIFYLWHLDGGTLSASMALPYFRHTFTFWLAGITSLTAGSIFLMWLGEQIDEYGLGNGISLIILAGIVARMPQAIMLLISQTNLSQNMDPNKPITPGKILFLIAAFVFVTAGSILITNAQRRIPIQQAKHTRGRRVYGGQRQYLPLRVNHGGVMPIIFAQSLMLFPAMFLGWVSGAIASAGHATTWYGSFFSFFYGEFQRTGYIYIVTEIVLIYFFAYFWTTVQFQPKDMADQLRDYGSFVPGLRPGKRTSDYLEKVMMRITYVGGAALAIIAVVPPAVAGTMGIPWQITAFLGGTGLLIVVAVALDMIQRIEANLLMRNYSGFLTKGRIKGERY